MWGLEWLSSLSVPKSAWPKPWLLQCPLALSMQPVSVTCKSPLWLHRGEMVNMEKDNLMKTSEPISLILEIKKTPILLLASLVGQLIKKTLAMRETWV